MIAQQERTIDQKSTQAKAFAYWAKRYRRDVLVMSCDAFADYLAGFISLLLRDYRDLLTATQIKECEAKLSGSLSEMVRRFEKEEEYSERSMNKAWRRLFTLFCMTGDVRSKYDIYSYLNTGDTSLLPSNVWQRKDIFSSQRKGANGDTDLKKRVETLEAQLAAFMGGAKIMETSETTVSLLLSDFVRAQMIERGVERSAILNSLVGLMNEEGANFVRMEIETILDRIDDDLHLGRVRAIVKRISQLEILLKEDGKPYTASELLSMPLGFELVKEDQRLPRSR